jgi:AcrR family transcriptional regulator
MASAAQIQIRRAAIRLFAERGAMQVSVTDLAQAAGLARGTIYNNLRDLKDLFETVSIQLAAEMSARVAAALSGLSEPAARLAAGVRLHVLCAASDPEIGRFLIRFGFSAAALREIWAGRGLADLIEGRTQGVYDYPEDRLEFVVNFISGATFGAIATALERPESGAEAGMDAAERILVALGVARSTARDQARAALPRLGG